MSSEKDITGYIESGILELYASGALSLAESAEVEAMAAQHPEVASELILITEALAGYASAYERHPRPALRRLVMDNVQKDAVPKENPREGNTKKAPSSSAMAYKYLLAAAMASLVISTFASYFFYNRWSETEDKNLSLLTEKNVLSQNYTAVKSVFDKTYGDLIVMRDINTKVFTLLGSDSTKNFAVRVYWNNLSHETFLDVQSLPVPETGRQYQLWAMFEGKPVDAGVFDANEDSGLNHMKSVFEAQSWSVTLEPAGGSATPTLSAVVLVSKERSS